MSGIRETNELGNAGSTRPEEPELVVSMSIEEARWLDLSHAADARGILTAIEGGRDIPFEIRRVFYMHATPAGVERGGHAHRTTRQILIAISGRFEVEISDGVAARSFELADPNRGLYIPAMIWTRLYHFSPQAVCLVLADTHYDRSQSLRTWDDFMRVLELERKT